VDSKKIASDLVRLAKVISASEKPYTFFRVLVSTLDENLKDFDALEWSDEQLNDEELGKDVDALKEHIDSAIGRASKIVRRLKP